MHLLGDGLSPRQDNIASPPRIDPLQLGALTVGELLRPHLIAVTVDGVGRPSQPQAPGAYRPVDVHHRAALRHQPRQQPAFAGLHQSPAVKV